MFQILSLSYVNLLISYVDSDVDFVLGIECYENLRLFYYQSLHLIEIFHFDIELMMGLCLVIAMVRILDRVFSALIGLARFFVFFHQAITTKFQISFFCVFLLFHCLFYNHPK